MPQLNSCQLSTQLRIAPSLLSLPCKARLSCQTELGPRLASISRQPPSLLFTGWLSNGNWKLSTICSAISSQSPLQISTVLPTLTRLAKVKVSYVTTDGQSASLSWNKAPIWGSKQDLYYCQAVAGLLMWGALSEERTGMSFARVPLSSNKSVVCIIYIFLFVHRIATAVLVVCVEVFA
jgi:hypothetical protein